MASPHPPPKPHPLEGFDFAALREALTDLGCDGWLVFDFRGLNPVAARVLGEGAGGMGTRRLFVLLPRDGTPVAVVHRIEAQALEGGGFPGEVRPYGAWGELDRKSTRLNSSHIQKSRMPSSA